VRAIAIGLLLCACDPVSITGAWCSYPADCHRPNVCSFNRCRQPCSLDSDCTTHRCLPGALNGCEVPQDHGCATAGNACGASLVCVEDRCSAPCTGATSCVPDAICRRASGSADMICADPSEVVPDAGTPDGSFGQDAGRDGA
jgi:hypothetical protein